MKPVNHNNNRFHLIKYLDENYCYDFIYYKYDEWVINHASQNGHISVLFLIGLRIPALNLNIISMQ